MSHTRTRTCPGPDTHGEGGDNGCCFAFREHLNGPRTEECCEHHVTTNSCEVNCDAAVAGKPVCAPGVCTAESHCDERGLPTPHPEGEAGTVQPGEVRMTQAEVDALLEYSRSLPTGTTPGKRWKLQVYAKVNGKTVPDGWWLGEYGKVHGDQIDIQWSRISIAPAPAETPAGSREGQPINFKEVANGDEDVRREGAAGDSSTALTKGIRVGQPDSNRVAERPASERGAGSGEIGTGLSRDNKTQAIAPAATAGPVQPTCAGCGRCVDDCYANVEFTAIEFVDAGVQANLATHWRLVAARLRAENVTLAADIVEMNRACAEAQESFNAEHDKTLAHELDVTGHAACIEEIEKAFHETLDQALDRAENAERELVDSRAAQVKAEQESAGRLKALTVKAEEARAEWKRAEGATARADAAEQAMSAERLAEKTTELPMIHDCGRRLGYSEYQNAGVYALIKCSGCNTDLVKGPLHLVTEQRYKFVDKPKRTREATVKPVIPVQPGTIFKHYKTGNTYRKLFETNNERQGDPGQHFLMLATVTTDGPDDQKAAWIYTMDGGGVAVFIIDREIGNSHEMHLARYPGVVYIALDGDSAGSVFFRAKAEFEAGVLPSEPHPMTPRNPVPRFQDVTVKL